MQPREKFIKALHREPIEGHVPTFELVFYLTMESVGRVHPLQRNYDQWMQMSWEEKKLHLKDIALAFIEPAEKYGHGAIFVQPSPGPWKNFDQYIETVRVLCEMIRELSGDRFALMLHGDPTPGIPSGTDMMEFSADMYDNPDKIHEQTKRKMADYMHLADALSRYPELLDGFCLCSDYCFNTSPFFSNEMFDEFIGPYLKDMIAYYHEHGYFAIKHTDGNVMPLLDRLVACKPDAIHSLDPQGGVDLKEVKRLYGDQVCLIGNVHCGKMQTGSKGELIEDVRRALHDGMPGYGYIFSTSNCVYTGLQLERYELMNKVWREEGIY